MSFQERLELLDDIKHCLIEERKFWLNQKDFKRVQVITAKLKLHCEQVAKVNHLMRQAA